jgi:hypothetical protein
VPVHCCFKTDDRDVPAPIRVCFKPGDAAAPVPIRLCFRPSDVAGADLLNDSDQIELDTISARVPG